MNSPALDKRESDSHGVMRRLSYFKPLSAAIQAIRQYFNRGRFFIEPPSFAKSRDPEIRRKIQRDWATRKAMDLRRYATAGADLTFVAPDKESRALVPIFETAFATMTNLDDARLEWTNAIFEGIAWSRVLSEYRTFGVGRYSPRSWWLPVFQHVHPDAIRQDITHIEEVDRLGQRISRPMIKWSTYDLYKEQWYEVADFDNYIRVTYNDYADTLGYGDGLYDALYWPWYVSTQIFEKLLVGLDRYAYPFMHVAIDPTAMQAGPEGGEGFPTPEEMASFYVDVFESMRSAGILVTDQNGKISPLDLSGHATEALLKIVQYLDQVKVELVLATSSTTGGREGGSYALAAVQQESTSVFIQWDRKKQEKALNRVAEMFFQYNLKNLLELTSPSGTPLGMLRRPYVKVGRHKFTSPAEMVQIAEKLGQMNIDLSLKEVMSHSGFTMPDDDDEKVISPAKLEAMMLASAAPGASGGPASTDPGRIATKPPTPASPTDTVENYDGLDGPVTT